MSIIYVLIPIAMLFVLIAFGIFFWAVKHDQFDDLERHGMSILFDEQPVTPVTSREMGTHHRDVTDESDSSLTSRPESISNPDLALSMPPDRDSQTQTQLDKSR